MPMNFSFRTVLSLGKHTSTSDETNPKIKLSIF